jgi:hypothetical protein
VIALTFWLSRKFGSRMEKHPFVHRLMNSISGSSLNQAESFLTQLSEFEEQELLPGTGEHIC